MKLFNGKFPDTVYHSAYRLYILHLSVWSKRTGTRACAPSQCRLTSKVASFASSLLKEAAIWCVWLAQARLNKSA